MNANDLERALFACEEYFRNAHYACNEHASIEDGSVGRHVRTAYSALEQMQRHIGEANHEMQAASKREEEHFAQHKAFRAQVEEEEPLQ